MTLLAGLVMADEPPKSAACALLTLDEAGKILGPAVAIGDDATVAAGIASCGWFDQQSFNTLSVTMSDKTALGGREPAQAFDDQKTAFAATGKEDEIADLGEKAYLLTPSDNEAKSLTLTFVKGSELVSLNTTGVERDGIIGTAKLMAGRL